MRSTELVALLAAAAVGAKATLYGESKLNHTCAITNDNAVLSCSPQADPLKVDSCCAETFGGLVLSTQFWDSYTGYESSGQLLPEDTWTLHGLWPDFCNGSYTQYCDPSRQYDRKPSPLVTNYPRANTSVVPYNGTSIQTFVKDFGKYDLLEYMNTYWINQGGSNNDFWEHEFAKHGTCFSTFDTPCYGPQYVEHEDIIDFFQTAILYYRRFPTWGFLAGHGIRPSNTTTYSLSDFQSALTQATSVLPFIGCSGPRYNTTAAGAGSLDNGYTVVSEVWYYLHAFGRLQQGVTLPVNATGYTTSCATTKGALHYYERTPSSLRYGVAAGY